MSPAATGGRRRMSYDERHDQLLDSARDFLRREGVDALTPAKLAEHAGVTKPLVYQHFGTRAGILVELYREFKGRTYDKLDAAAASADPATTADSASLAATAQVIADSYLDCIDEESAAIPGVSGALSGSAELEQLRQEADVAFSARCRAALLPFATSGEIPEASMQAILGAADGIARAYTLGRVPLADGRIALAKVVAAVT